MLEILARIELKERGVLADSIFVLILLQGVPPPV